MGVTIHRDEEAERHLDFLGVEASNLGTHDVFFRQKVSVSAILEETYHIRQNRQGMNDDKPKREATKIHLAQYEEALKNYDRGRLQ